MVLLTLWTLYYAYAFVWGLFDARFMDLNRLPSIYGLTADDMTPAARNTVFFAWLPTTLGGLAGFIFGIIGAYNVYQGRMFDPSALWPVVAIGIATCFSIVTGLVGYNLELDAMWPLMGRDPATRPYYWTQVEIAVFFFGLGFILLGFLQIEATKILKENKEFI
ncbi:MAG: hypothetical protein AAF386_01080 [Pseudomonadota bacterium]